MERSYHVYPATAGQTDFQVTFPFIYRAHVFVSVNGTDAGFTWIDDGTVRLASSANEGDTVRVYRATPREPLRTLSDNSSNRAEAYNTLSLQAMYLGQEAADLSDEVLAYEKDFDARMVAGVAAVEASTAEAAQSETNAAASEAASLANRMAAATSETNAAASEVAAGQHEAAAAASASNAATSEANSATSETNAATSETNAQAAQVAAEAARDEANASATSASADAATATQKATEAAASAADAAASAAVTASFDPNSYYTRNYLDTALAAKADDANLGTNGRRNLYVSSTPPADTDGVDGDIWFII